MRLILLCLLGGLLVQERVLAAGPTTAECLAASEQSLSLRRAHKLLDARAQDLICSSPRCPAAIRDECSQRVAEIKASIPTIVFEAKDAAGNDVVEVTVRADGRVLADRLDGTALPIDPGPHVFQFQVSGRLAIVKRFVVHEGEKDRRERIVFSDSGAADAPPASIVADARPQPAPPAAADSITTRRILAIASASVGVVGLGIGIGYGIYSWSRHDAAQSTCPSAPCANPADSNVWHQAVSAGNVATAGFIVGGIGIAGGLALWRTW
jgi:hypothetical protein